MSWKKALKVISETLGHFANTLNVGHKYSRLNRDNLTVPIQMQLSLTEKLFPNFFFFTFDIKIKFWTFSKKKITHMYLSNYGLRKTWLDICLKSTVLEDPSTSNMVNGTKY